MRAFPIISAATFLLTGLLPTGFAAAAEPTPIGEWRTEEGYANVRVDDCNGALWGVISWEKTPGGVDSNNPNPAERNHPTLGLHILLAMKPTQPGLWEGGIYNPENGKTYDSKISLSSPDVLRVEGCVLGFLCGGQNWTRIKAEPVASTQQRPPQRAGKAKDKDAVQPLSACAGLPAGPK